METLKKQTNIGGDVKETDKCSWRRESNRQIYVETLKKQTDIGGDVKETDLRGEVKLTLNYSRRRGKTDKYWWRR